MKKFINFKIICIIILLCLIMYCIYETFLSGTKDIIHISRAISILVIYCCILIGTGRKIEKILFELFEKNYSNVLDDTFSNNEKSRKILMKSIFFCATSRYRVCLNLLKSLAGKCNNNHDEDAVFTVLKTCVSKAHEMKDQKKRRKIFLTAISVYNAFINYHTPLCDLYVQISSLYSYLNDIDSGIEYALKAFELDNNNYIAAVSLSMFYAYKKEHEKAEKFQKIAEELNPDDGSLRLIMNLVGAQGEEK